MRELFWIAFIVTVNLALLIANMLVHGANYVAAFLQNLF